ncbi:N-acyl-phosphatidylethanolamine-hydrolyzing phospholipase D-like [Amphiura filiformis]|uniref:N-acyl-phosphatidylethanolamine-hydrolyzing phospholipase D-like n=1 Tax=Amphiura filiformis TaxID=82378 RepID=UPI003B224C9E
MIWWWIRRTLYLSLGRNLTRKRVVPITTVATVTAAAVIASKKFDSENSGQDKQSKEVMADNSTPSVCKYSKMWGFSNPFENWREPNLMTVVKWKTKYTNETNLPEDKKILDEKLPVLTPSFKPNAHNDVCVTWIGHATTLVQMDGVNILTDPVFSDTAGPSICGTVVGDKRYRPPACKVGDLPDIHAVVISHSHYDHLDSQSVHDLHERFKENIHWFVPKNLKSWFTGCGCRKENVHEMDWWEEKDMPGHPGVKLAFTPAQHWSARNIVLDKNKTLWGSWCVIGPKHRFHFAGDTGYCEAFKQIGEKYGPFDLAAIPIGAYLPRPIMEPQHVDPAQAVLIHQDVQAKKSVGIHWGTFALAYEYYLQPPQDLKKALEEKQISEEEFFVLKHGESRNVSTEDGQSKL